jgi:hypothetical protein
MIRISTYVHGHFVDPDVIIFEKSDIRVIHMDKGDFIQQSDFDLILESLQNYGSLDVENIYEFDCERVYSEDNDSDTYLWFKLDNPKKVIYTEHE